MPTVLIAFDTELGPAVVAEIEKCGNPLGFDIRKKLNAANVIHFASLSVVEISKTLSYLMIELSADAGNDAALRVFATAMAPALTRILDAAAIPRPAQLGPWLIGKSLSIGSGIFTTCGLLFDGAPEMTVSRIRREDRLVRWIKNHLEVLHGAGSAEEKLSVLRRALWRDGNFKPAFVPQPAPFLAPAPARDTMFAKLKIGARLFYGLFIWPSLIFPILFFIIVLLPGHCGWLGHIVWALFEAFILLILVVGAFLLAIRRAETRDPAPLARPKKADLEKILERENWTSQNILVTTSVLKPGWLRRVSLYVALFGIKTVLPLFWAPGRLGNINDIHFARWVLAPKSDILIFRSHYDGSWLHYVEDFVLRAPQGVSAIWSNTRNFPRTRWLAQDGARDGPRFLQWARTQTRPAPFLYSAYPGLSMERIRLHARIARAIATGEMDEGVRGWLASLGDADGGDF